MQLLTKRIWYAKDHITFSAHLPPPIRSFEAYGVLGLFKAVLIDENFKI